MDYSFDLIDLGTSWCDLRGGVRLGAAAVSGIRAHRSQGSGGRRLTGCIAAGKAGRGARASFTAVKTACAPA